MEKATIFIDGGYLNRVLKNSFGGIDVDYIKLSNEISEDLKVERLRTYYYHCLPIIRSGNKEDEKLHANMQRFSKISKDCRGLK